MSDRRGGVSVGTFALAGSAHVCELLARIGLAFVIVDCEHSPISPVGGQLVEMVRAVEAGGATPWVRVLSNDPGQISKTLDAGARCVIVPHVRTADDAARAVRGARRPPNGIRGAAPVVRSAWWGAMPWNRFIGGAEPQVCALIEDPEAVDHIEEIVAVPGLDAIMFGSYDLAVTLGREDPRAPDPEIERLRERTYHAAADAGVVIADYAWSAEIARRFASQGAQYVAVSTDLSVLVSGFAQLVEIL